MSVSSPQELQATEIDVLRSIYDADFLPDPLPNAPRAWGGEAKKGGEYGIRVRSRADARVEVVLVVKYPKAYPRAAPILSFTSPSSQLPPTVLPSLLKRASALAASQLPEVVIFNVAGFVEDWLTDNVKVPEGKGLEGLGKGEAMRESLAAVARRREEEKAIAAKELEKESLTLQAKADRERALRLSHQVEEVKKLQQSRLSHTLPPHLRSKSGEKVGGSGGPNDGHHDGSPFPSSSGPSGVDLPQPWSEINFGTSSSATAAAATGSAGAQMLEHEQTRGPRMVFKLLGGRRSNLWSEYLALPAEPRFPADDGEHDTSDDYASWGLSGAGGEDLLDRPMPSNLNVVTVDFPAQGYYGSPQGLAKLNALFETLARLTRLQSTGGIIPVLGAKLAILPRGGGRRLAILQERVGRGERLRGVMRVCGKLEGGVAKDHLVQVLAGLESLRAVGLTHDDISLDTIVLSTSSFGGARLAEPYFRRRIADLDRSNPFLALTLDASLALSSDGGAYEDERGDSNEGERLPWNWLSPDEIEAGYAFGHKRDVWHAGVCFLRMLAGTDVVYRYANLEAVLESDEFYVPPVLQEVLRGMLHPFGKERWSAQQAIMKLSQADLDGVGLATGNGKSRDRSAERAGRSGSGENGSDPTKALVLRANGRGPPQSPNQTLGGTHYPFLSAAGQRQLPQPAPYGMVSRYQADFEEVEFLGEGGFGKVVKAKNKLDGRFYAIKKIKLRPEDNEQKVFREVNALSRLNHQFIVRYYTCWLETTAPPPNPLAQSTSHSTTMTSSVSSLTDLSVNSSSANSPSGTPAPSPFLGFDGFKFEPDDADFLSVRGGQQSRSLSFPRIHFGDDEDDEDDDEEDSSDADSSASGSQSDGTRAADDSTTEEERSRSARLKVQRRKSSDRNGRLLRKVVGQREREESTDLENSGLSAIGWGSRVLYIQMEYVENQTLKEAIGRGLSEDESWRLFRQTLEALVHMASLGIVHRDLKPSNLLIDHENCIKIGDFGLAATDFAPMDTPQAGTPLQPMESSLDLTSGIGTSLYIAPEVESTTGRGGSEGRYDDKADLYSLGIIFFEMCFPLETAMERAFLIRDLRSPHIKLPATWPAAKAQQAKIILQLLQHEPAKRPRAINLLTSGLLPSVKEDEYFSEALRTFGNPSSTRYPVLFDHVFSHMPDPVSDYTFDDPAQDYREHRVYESLVKERLVELFRRHGAIDYDPPPLLPVTELLNFRREPGARFLNRQGQLVELPYDGLVTFARHIARTKRLRLKRYHIGSSFRESSAGGQPNAFGEIAYDILSPVRSMASEAELISVLDRILDSFPGLSEREWEFHISHNAVLELMLERIPSARRTEVCDVLREMGGKTTFPHIRSKLGLARTALDYLEKWAVSDSLETVLDLLCHRFPQLSAALRKATREVAEAILLATKFGVRRRIVFKPTLSHRFFQSGVLIECVRKSPKREVLAVGGRYDNLVEHFRLPETNTSIAPKANLVGMHIALEKITYLVGRFESAEGKRLLNLENEDARSFGHAPRRCDVYIGSFGVGSKGSMEDRVEIAGELWGAGLRADLMYDDGLDMALEEVTAECLAQGVLFLVITKGKGRPLLKVRSILRRTEEDVFREDLLPYLRQHIADQRRVDTLAAPPASHLPLVALDTAGVLGGGGMGGGGGGKAAALAHGAEPVRLILPSDKPIKDSKGQHKKLFRHGTKALWYEKARSFLALARSPLCLFAVDVPAPVLSLMALETTWLEPDEAVASVAWKAIKEHCAHSQAAYMNGVRDELRDACAAAQHAQPCEPGMVWLFGVRDERGFLLQWPARG